MKKIVWMFAIVFLSGIETWFCESAFAGRIAFVSDRDGNEEIYLMDMDGSNQIRLTHDPGADTCPVFSPNGKTIAFFSNRIGSYRVYIMNWNGTNIQEIPNSECAIGSWIAGRGIAWSPDGQKLLLKPSNISLATINLDGSGKSIIWSGSINGHDLIQGVEWGPTLNDIYVNAQNYGWGYDQHVFRSQGSSTEITGWIQVTNDIQPWHSMSPQVSYQVHHIVLQRQEDWLGPCNIYTMGLNGEDMVKLTYDADYRTRNYDPDWIDNGNGITFCFGLWYDYSTWSTFQICIMDSTGVNRYTLTNEGSNYMPSWTPLPLIKIDIKPCSCPNPLNVADKGLLPVAICGSEDFDVSTIDTASIRLEGVAPIRSSYEDVATPMTDVAELCECTTAGPDGQLDLTLKFNIQDIVAAMGQINDGDELELTLTGALDEAFGGTSIKGTDCVLIISKDPK
jgi:hypothetical protein